MQYASVVWKPCPFKEKHSEENNVNKQKDKMHQIRPRYKRIIVQKQTSTQPSLYSINWCLRRSDWSSGANLAATTGLSVSVTGIQWYRKCFSSSSSSAFDWCSIILKASTPASVQHDRGVIQTVARLHFSWHVGNSFTVIKNELKGYSGGKMPKPLSIAWVRRSGDASTHRQTSHAVKHACRLWNISHPSGK